MSGLVSRHNALRERFSGTLADVDSAGLAIRGRPRVGDHAYRVGPRSRSTRRSPIRRGTECGQARLRLRRAHPGPGRTGTRFPPLANVLLLCLGPIPRRRRRRHHRPPLGSQPAGRTPRIREGGVSSSSRSPRSGAASTATTASGSPYRRLIALEVAERRGAERTGRASRRGPPVCRRTRWRAGSCGYWRPGASVNPDSMIEPWDWYYQTGKVSRQLSPRISRERLTALNREVYRSLGVDVRPAGRALRPGAARGKDTGGVLHLRQRPRYRRNRRGARPWVFATYRTGGLDNLDELLHETGHAVHIAAIRTRPAFADWPDSDPFTEAVADFVALEVSEPEWQQRWLGDSVPLADGLRGALRRHRAGRGLVAVRAENAAGHGRRSQSGVDRPDQQLPPHPPAPGAFLVGHAGPAGRRAGLHDELRGRIHPDRGDPGANPAGCTARSPRETAPGTGGSLRGSFASAWSGPPVR